jgi:hypothetical protein
MSQSKSSSGIFGKVAAGLILAGFYQFFIRPQLLKWGTRLGEAQRRLPGDAVIPSPNMVATRAVAIDAPPEAVWPWIAQMGRARTGWYSYYLLDNNGIPSATYIRKDLELPQPGDSMDRGLQVLEVEPNRRFLIGGYDLPNMLGTATDTTILYQLERMSDGGTRLLVRIRAYSYGFAGQVFNAMLELLDFVMMQKQLKGIKARAETMAHLQYQPPQEREISLN